MNQNYIEELYIKTAINLLDDLKSQKISKKTGYSVTGDSLVEERLIEFNPNCFKVISQAQKKDNHRKVLIADWRLYYGVKNYEEIMETYSQLLKYLLKNHFFIYIFYGKALVEVLGANALLQRHGALMELISENEIKTQLSLLGYDSGQFFIFRDFHLSQIMQTIQYLGQQFIDEKQSFDSTELAELKKHITPKLNHTLIINVNWDDITIKSVLNASDNKQIRTIELDLPCGQNNLDKTESNIKKVIAHLDNYFGKNKRPPGLKFNFINYFVTNSINFDSFMESVMMAYPAHLLSELTLLNYYGPLSYLFHYSNFKKLTLTPNYRVNPIEFFIKLDTKNFNNPLFKSLETFLLPPQNNHFFPSENDSDFIRVGWSR